MRFIALTLILLAVIAAVIGPQLFFIVDEKQIAIVTRFGEVQHSITNPGLYIKTPFIDSTTYYDKRLLIFDAPPDSLLTKDKKRLIIDVYARGKIVDPKLFRETVRTEAGGKARAVDIISSELRREIASDNQAEIITTKREDIMNRVRDNVQPKLDEFGLDIIDVRIKRADFPPEIAESVYARMQAERKRKADKERAEGAEIDAQVRATVDRDATIIRANAQRTADITRGQGDAQAVQVFADAISANPEFYSFQRSLDAYRKIFESNSTMVLPPDSNLFEFLQSPSGLSGDFKEN
ncbi:MAG: protease modulator HflC [Dehalococcoidia bacterium]|nr:protease modulator HflC [Dehalococcoidia bacterium]